MRSLQGWEAGANWPGEIRLEGLIAVLFETEGLIAGREATEAEAMGCDTAGCTSVCLQRRACLSRFRGRFRRWDEERPRVRRCSANSTRGVRPKRRATLPGTKSAATFPLGSCVDPPLRQLGLVV